MRRYLYFIAGLLFLLPAHGASTVGIRAISRAAQLALTNETTPGILTGLGAVNIAGDTMTGALEVPDLTVTGTGTYATVNATTLTVGDATGLGGTPIDVQWYGAVADDGTNDYTAIVAAKAAADAAKRPLYFPKGKYELSGTQYIEVSNDMVVVGDGTESQISHDGRYNNNSIFSLTGGSRLILRNITFANSRWVVPLTAGYPTIERLELDGVTITNVSQGIWGYFTGGIYTNKNVLKELVVNRSRHYGVQTNGAGHFIYLSGVPYEKILVNDFYSSGGNQAIAVEMDNTHSNQNWVPYVGQLTVMNSVFEDMDNPLIAGGGPGGADTGGTNTVAVKFMARGALIMGNRFQNIAATTVTGERCAIYAYGGHSRIWNNTFYNIGGTGSSGPETIIIKGASIVVDPANGTTETVSDYNHVSGWRAWLHGNIFQGIKETAQRTGYVLFDTDAFVATRNTWVDCTNISAGLNFAPSTTTYNETGLFVVEGNEMVRSPVPLFRVTTGSNIVNGVKFNNNLVYGSTTATAIYGLTFLNSVTNCEAVGNHIINSPGYGLLRIGTGTTDSRNWTYNNFRLWGNTLENTVGASGGYLALIGAAGNVTTALNWSLMDNVMNKAEPVYFSAGTNVIRNLRAVNHRNENGTYNYMWRVGTGVYDVSKVMYTSNHQFYVNINTNDFAMTNLYAPVYEAP